MTYLVIHLLYIDINMVATNEGKHDNDIYKHECFESYLKESRGCGIQISVYSHRSNVVLLQ